MLCRWNRHVFSEISTRLLNAAMRLIKYCLFFNCFRGESFGKKRRFGPPISIRFGKRKKGSKGPEASNKMPNVAPLTRCKLRLLKYERIKDYLLMEEEFIRNQERLKPQEERQEEERTKVDEMRGSPMAVGTLEEVIDDQHAIFSTPGCAVLINHKTHAVGVLADDTDPMVSVMKLEKAPTVQKQDFWHLEIVECALLWWGILNL
uniref:Prot_ATP_ID_OB domain-containing protein n=1 Tax=Meloidogyne hapla TaxID=6305 RepID=A0A1I8BBX5_MELHA